MSATDKEGNAISYEIGSDADGKFNIDQSSGWITSNVVIDREVFLRYKAFSVFLRMYKEREPSVPFMLI